MALGFWGHCANAYAAATPHQGYSILKRWCAAKDQNAAAAAAAAAAVAAAAGAPLNEAAGAEAVTSGLSAAESGRASFVYSSNVDGHFLRAGFPAAQVSVRHRSAGPFHAAAKSSL